MFKINTYFLRQCGQSFISKMNRNTHNSANSKYLPARTVCQSFSLIQGSTTYKLKTTGQFRKIQNSKNTHFLTHQVTTLHHSTAIKILTSQNNAVTTWDHSRTIKSLLPKQHVSPLFSFINNRKNYQHFVGVCIVLQQQFHDAYVSLFYCISKRCPLPTKFKNVYENDSTYFLKHYGYSLFIIRKQSKLTS